MSKSSLIYSVAADLWRAMRSDYEAALMDTYSAADQATHGYLLNKQGRHEHINPYDLFIGSETTAYRYASRELIEWWAQNGRLTLRAFEAQWLISRGEDHAFDEQWAVSA